MKVAIVHDWLVALRGGEKCLKFFLELYPKADIYTLFHKEGSTYPEIDKRVKKVSYLQKICFTDHRKLLPLYPLGARSLKISGYDLVISISHAAAKNVSILGESTLHISYCLTPMRYIWDQAESYLGNKRYLFYPLINRLREWDREGSERVDYFTAISKLVAARIRK
ncbi:MAG: glycosyltransferase family 4 protein, partial [Candidatus Dadabacteria bacterium]